MLTATVAEESTKAVTKLANSITTMSRAWERQTEKCKCDVIPNYGQTGVTGGSPYPFFMSVHVAELHERVVALETALANERRGHVVYYFMLYHLVEPSLKKPPVHFIKIFHMYIC